jgi:hypothetical protein
LWNFHVLQQQFNSILFLHGGLLSKVTSGLGG